MEYQADPMGVTTGSAAMTTAARVALVASADPRGQFDGAWWPHSRDFTTEAPPLLRALLAHGLYTRATVDLAFWAGPPRPFEVPILGRVIRWGGFAAGEDPHRIVLYSIRDSRTLLVIPPETDPPTAIRLTAAACSPLETRSATQLLTDIT